MRRFVPALVLAAALCPAFAGAQEGGGHAGHHDHGAAADPHAHHAAPPPVTGAQRLAGLAVPDLPLIDQDGRPVRFLSDLVRGKVVAINFVFTTCTTVCPPMGAIFGKLQQQLGERAGRDVFLVSVSVDPATDTPERLKAWGARFGAGPGWTLVTGEREKVTQLLEALGVYTPDFRQHSPTVLLGDEPHGAWTRAYGLAPPAELARLLDELTAPTKQAAHDGHHAVGGE